MSLPLQSWLYNTHTVIITIRSDVTAVTELALQHTHCHHYHQV